MSTDDAYEKAYRQLQARLLERSGAEVRSSWVTLPRFGKIHVLEAGTGAPVVIWHGGAGVGAEHIPILAHLARRFRVIVPDRPGHGLSDAFDYRCDLREANVELVGALLDQLGIDRAALVGNSYGGFMSVQFALARPERVSKLVLLSYFPGIGRALPLLMRLVVIPGIGRVLAATVARPSIKNTRAFFSKVLVAHVDRMPDELVELETLHSRQHARSIGRLFREGFTMRGFRPRYVVGPELPTLAVPTTWLWGERDVFMPVDEARAVAATIPGARFELIADAGHFVTADQPVATATAVERALGDL